MTALTTEQREQIRGILREAKQGRPLIDMLRKIAGVLAGVDVPALIAAIEQILAIFAPPTQPGQVPPPASMLSLDAGDQEILAEIVAIAQEESGDVSAQAAVDLGQIVQLIRLVMSLIEAFKPKLAA